MIKTLLLLTTLALVQAHPSDDVDPTNARLYEFHEDCPPSQVHFLLPHEYDCTKFYYCEYGLKWIEPRNCAPGTEFNAAIQVCVHPVNSGCTLPGFSTTPVDVTTEPGTTWPTSTAGTVAPTAGTTAAPTVAPTAGTTAAPTVAPTAGTTAAPTVAPTAGTTAPLTVAPTAGTTAAPTVAPTAGTTAAPTVAPTAGTTTELPCDTEGPVVPTAAPTAAPSTSAPASTADPDDCETLDNGCPADFSIHKLLPHEEYCHKFYYCDKGELVLRYCAPGTYFNPKLEVCDWPHNVDCVNDGSYEYPTTSAPATQPPSPPGGGGNDIGDILDNGCPADFDVHHLLPHETECNKFYYCVFGQKVERTCAPGTYFNYKIQVCDWPFNVNCVSTGTTPGGATDDTSSSEEIPSPSDPENPEDPIEWVPLPNGCPADSNINHLLPHESDCGKFYHCVHGQTLVRDCPAGTHFSPSQQICDWPQNAGCEHWTGGCSGSGNDNGGCAGTTAAPGGNDGTTAAPGGNEDTTAAPGGNDGTTAAPGSNDGTTTAGTTPGEATDDTSSSKEIPSPSDPENPEDPIEWVPLPNGCPADFNIHHLLPHESDCGKFYYCVHGQTLVRDCPGGTHFSPSQQICDWPQNAGCEHWTGGCSGSGNDNGGCAGTTAAPGGNDGTTAAPGGNEGTTAAPGGNDGTTAAPGSNDGTTTAGTTPGGATDDTSSSEEIPSPSDPENPEDPIEWVPLPNGCPADFNIHHLLPHESDCGKFYYCVHGQTLVRDCPGGTHFSPSQQTCDWPQNAGCEHWTGGCSGSGNDNGGCAGTTTAPGGNDGTTAAPGGSEGTTAVPGGNDGTTAAPGGNDGTTAAPGGNDGTTAAPGGNDGTTAAPGGNDGTTAAPGGNDGTTTAPGGNDGTTAATGGNDGTTAAPGGNDETTAAPGGNDGTTAAPGGNDGTTAAPGGNDGTTTAPGGNDGTTAAPGGNDGTTAAPGGNDGTSAAPGGNDGTTAAPGGNDGTTAAPGGNDGTTAAPGGTDETTAAPICTDGTTAAPGGNDGTTSAPGCDACRPVTPADRCKSGCNVLPFVHDNDCDKYWTCNGEQPLLVTCSEGLHFNPNTYTCDFICNAGCLRENVQITTLAEGVKLFMPWGSITSEMMNLLDAELNADL